MSRATRLTALFLATLLFVLPAYGAGQEPAWTEKNPATAPSRRVGHSIAYDSGSDRVVLFGGERTAGGGILINETWAYDFDSDMWENRNPSSGPSARFGQAMAYDATADRVILFGGWTGTVQSTETWAYDYETNTWTNMSPTTSPSAGLGANMAYDAESDRIVLFGGGTFMFGGSSAETWVYAFSTNSWTLMNPADSPSPRQAFGMMAYDAESDLIVLFGGQDGLARFDDTWAYDHDSVTWTQMNPEASPSAVTAASMTYDSGADRIILFGGLLATASAVDQTWVYNVDSDTWRLETDMGPSSRYGAPLAYDAQSEVSILFGGSIGGDQTWSHRFVSPPGPAGTDVWWYIAVGVAIAAAAAAATVFLLRQKRGKQGT